MALAAIPPELDDNNSQKIQSGLDRIIRALHLTTAYGQLCRQHSWRKSGCWRRMLPANHADELTFREYGMIA